MAIMNRSMGIASAAKTQGTYWELIVQPTDASEHLSVATLNGIAVGVAPTGFAAFYTKSTQSLFFTAVFGGGTLTSFVLTLTGDNQFGERVTEDITFTAVTALTAQSVLCYRRLVSLVVKSYTGTQTPAAGDTISLGYSLVGPRVPFLAKIPAGGVLRMTDINQISTQPTFAAQDVVSGQPRHNILTSAVTIAAPTTGHGLIYCQIDANAIGL